MNSAEYSPETTAVALANRLMELEKDSKVKGILVLAADGNNYNAEEVSTLLKSISKPVFGGIFPGLIFKNNKFDKGFIVAGLSCEICIDVIEDISSPQTDFNKHLLGFAERFVPDIQSLFVFVDGISERINSFIDSIFMVLGLEYNYVGGGCGSLSFTRKPCVFTNKGMLCDAAVVVAVAMKSGVGVAHGWKAIKGPFKVTSCSGTVIKELNFKPAFNVYKKVIEGYTKKKMSRKKFFDIAKSFPFGVQKLGAEKIVRDPFAIGEDDSIVCVGEIEPGSYLYVLHGEKNRLIKAAQTAAEIALEDKTSNSNSIFLVDCISRVLFLGDDFNLELEVVGDADKSLSFFGILSIGEIANNKKDYLDFFNKT